jgi:hypothetical protein
MSDLTMIAEHIHEVMQAIEDAHRASENLREEANHKTFDAFRERMLELQEHLGKLKMVLDNEEAYAMDELVDALSRAYTDHRAEYRRTPRMAEE